MHTCVTIDKPQRRPAPEELSWGSHDGRSVDYDWSEHDPEGDWEVVMPDFRSYERKLLLLYAKENSIDLEEHFGGKRELKETPDEAVAEFLSERWNEEGSENPVMNYYYPIHIGWSGSISAEDAQFILSVNHLCLTVVHMMDDNVSDDYVLALTGGGMDLTWEICEAFCLLGQIPPSSMSDVPDMSGRGMSKRDQWILACIKRGHEANIEQAKSALARHEDKIKRGKRDLRRKSMGKKPYYAAGGYVAFGDWEAAKNCKELRGNAAVLYELVHRGRDDFRSYFVCDSQASVDALHRKYTESVRLMSGQCDCTGTRFEPSEAIRPGCYECHGLGRKPLCQWKDNDCINRVVNHGEKFCRHHKIIDEADREATSAE